MASSALNGAPSPGSSAIPEQKLKFFELAVTVLMNDWTALSVAVSEESGGPDSADKRDWFCSEVVDFLRQFPDADEAFLEEKLDQVMVDEFCVGLEDDSEVDLARRIMHWKGECEKGAFQGVKDLYAQWSERNAKRAGVHARVRVVEQDEDGDEGSVGDESDESDGDDDVDMDDVAPKKRPEPEVDDDGFTKVVGKKRR